MRWSKCLSQLTIGFQLAKNLAHHKWKANGRGEVTSPRLIAAFAQLGDTDESLKWLVQASDTGFPGYPWFDQDTLLDLMRRHLGFLGLLTRLRDAHQQARRRAQ